MWAIDRPAVTAAETARACAGPLQNKQDRIALLSAVAHLADNSDQYQECGTADQLYLTTAEQYAVPGLTDEQLRSIYDRQLGRSTNTGGGRVRSKLMAAAPHGCCAYCRYSPASTLDHFVPKSVVAGLALEPWNLIPSCPRCNQKIGSQWSDQPDEQMLHPYFVASLGRWLHAAIIHDEPPAARFFVDLPVDTDPALRTRICKQFDRLQLGEMYSVTSSSDLAVTHQLLTQTALTRPEDIGSYLMENAKAEFVVDTNARRGVLYEALAHDEWFIGRYADL